MEPILSQMKPNFHTPHYGIFSKTEQQPDKTNSNGYHGYTKQHAMNKEEEIIILF
jgi:hypothetical protein